MYRILVVDDIPVISDSVACMLQLQLQNETVQVLNCYSSYEAIEIANNHKIDILLTDISMPGQTGLDLVKVIKILWKECKIIFLSSYSDFEYAKEAISLGCTDYVLKMDGDEQVLKVVNKTIELIKKDNSLKSKMIKHDNNIDMLYHSSERTFFSNLYYNEIDDLKNHIESKLLPIEIEKNYHYIIIKIEKSRIFDLFTEKEVILSAFVHVFRDYFQKETVIYAIAVDNNQIAVFIPEQEHIDRMISQHVKEIQEWIYENSLTSTSVVMLEKAYKLDDFKKMKERMLRYLRNTSNNRFLLLPDENSVENKFVESNLAETANFIKTSVKIIPVELLSVFTLADYVGLNSVYMARVFKKQENIKISDYINDYKIEFSKSLLAEKSLRVEDVSTRVGFTSSESFIRFFKRLVGIPPAEYRKSISSKKSEIVY